MELLVSRGEDPATLEAVLAEVGGGLGSVRLQMCRDSRFEAVLAGMAEPPTS